MLTDEDIANNYLKSGPAYFGTSGFRDRDVVKSNGGRWNADRKEWEARSHESLKSLILSKRWHPSGLSPSEARFVVMIIDKSDKRDKHDKRGNAHVLFHRRVLGSTTFDPVNDTHTLPNGKKFTYARTCRQCCVLVDSRLQFGLECDCPLGCAWNSCSSCRLPLYGGEPCPACCPEKARMA